MRENQSVSSNIPTPQSPEGRQAETSQQKVDLLRQVFFPQPPQADLADIEGSGTTHQTSFPPINEQEVRDAIRRAPVDKALGEDGIPNRVWKTLLANDDFVSIVTGVFDACMRTGYNPRHFQAQGMPNLMALGGWTTWLSWSNRNHAIRTSTR
jgi:hypothetical protein